MASKRKSGIIVPHKATWYQRLAARVVHLSLSTLYATLRCRLHPGVDLKTNVDPGPVIFVTWHNRLALSMLLFNRYVRNRLPGRRLAAMVSASRDGALLARILENFEVQPVRGSSSRRGPQALLELTTWAKQGYDLAITPDGPRGPRYCMQPGVVALSQLTGRAILPMSAHMQWKIQAKSWDRFQIPLPFSRCEITLGTMMRLPSEATDAERETFRQQIESELRRITRD